MAFDKSKCTVYNTCQVIDPTTDGQVFENKFVENTPIATAQNGQKGFLSRFRITSGTVTYKNLGANNIRRDGPGTHTDGIWIAADKSATGLVLKMIDCKFTNIDGPSVLIESGSYKRLYFKNVAVDWKIEIKLNANSTVEEAVFDGCSGGISITNVGGTLKKLYVNNHTPPVTGGNINGVPVIVGLPPDLTPTPPDPTPPTKTVKDIDILLTSSELKTSLSSGGNIVLLFDKKNYRFSMDTPLPNVSGIKVTFDDNSTKTYYSNSAGTVKLTMNGFTYSFSE